MSEIICKVCNNQPKRYKCKDCYIPYCSLQCYKEHSKQQCSSKDKDSVKDTFTSKTTTSHNQEPENTTHTIDPLTFEQLYFIRKGILEEDYIPEETLRKIASDNKLNNILKDDSILKVIRDIVDSEATKFNSEQEKDIIVNIQRYMNSLDKEKQHPLEELLPYLLTLLK